MNGGGGGGNGNSGASNLELSQSESSSSSSSTGNNSNEEYHKSSYQDDFSYEWSNGLPIERLFYFDPIDHLITFQTGQSGFNVFRGKRMTHLCTVPGGGKNSHGGGFGGSQGQGQSQGVGHTSEMLSAEYISKYHWIITSANDRSIKFWDSIDHYKHIKNISHNNTGNNNSINDATSSSQICMRWSPTNNILFTGTDQKLGQIKAWKIEKSNNITSASSTTAASGINSSFIHSSNNNNNTNKLNHYTTEVVSTFSGQNDITLDLLVLENMSSLASASMDTTIGLYDLTTNQRTSILKNGHSKGVFQLSYHSSYHVLCSSGYEHSAIVWNPYVSAKICSLKGHYSTLIGTQCIPNSPHILTADSSGIIKIWDIRNFSCQQTIYIEDKESRITELNSFITCASHKRIISSSGHKLFLHDSLTSSSFQLPHITDLEPIIKCLYNTLSGTFITASGTTIKIWNGSNGVLERTYRNILRNNVGSGSSGHNNNQNQENLEITALCLDDSQKNL